MCYDLPDYSVDFITLYFAQSKHRLDPLPAGWFYNGSHYVSLTGDKNLNHPRILCVRHQIMTDCKLFLVIPLTSASGLRLFQMRRVMVTCLT